VFQRCWAVTWLLTHSHTLSPIRAEYWLVSQQGLLFAVSGGKKEGFGKLNFWLCR
jgi:hypothetical protein